jgi:hypothetical protein
LDRDYFYRKCIEKGLDIAFRIDNFGDPGRGGYFPGLKDLMVQTDLNGKMGNFLASKDDYEFVKNLHKKNMIILVVRDFGGKKALAAIGDYLSKSGYKVSAFYTSNVEQYLFQDPDNWKKYYKNVATLPLNASSTFIRSIGGGRGARGGGFSGPRLGSVLSSMQGLLKEFNAGRITSYTEVLQISK